MLRRFAADRNYSGLFDVTVDCDSATTSAVQESDTMAILDWKECCAVESVPGKVSGAWVFKDTRLPVATVIENLEDLSVAEVMEQFDVTREQITAVLDFVARSLGAPSPAARVDAHSL